MKQSQSSVDSVKIPKPLECLSTEMDQYCSSIEAKKIVMVLLVEDDNIRVRFACGFDDRWSKYFSRVRGFTWVRSSQSAPGDMLLQVFFPGDRDKLADCIVKDLTAAGYEVTYKGTKVSGEGELKEPIMEWDNV